MCNSLYSSGNVAAELKKTRFYTYFCGTVYEMSSKGT